MSYPHTGHPIGGSFGRDSATHHRNSQIARATPHAATPPTASSDNANQNSAGQHSMPPPCRSAEIIPRFHQLSLAQNQFYLERNLYFYGGTPGFSSFHRLNCSPSLSPRSRILKYVNPNPAPRKNPAVNKKLPP